MQLQQLRLYMMGSEKGTHAETLIEETLSPAEMPKLPQRSLEDEAIHVQGSGSLKLMGFDVVETLGALPHSV